MGDLGQMIFTPFHLQHEESIYNAVKHSKAVINLVGKNYSKYLSGITQREVNVDGAERLARICREAGVERFIHFSSLGANVNSDLPFYVDKAHSESAVREAFPSATILRPANVLGLEDNFMSFFIARSMFKISPFIANKRDVVKQPVYVADVAAAAVQCLEDPSTAGQTFELVGPKSYQLQDMVHYFHRLMFKRFIPIGVPEKLFLLSCWPYEFALRRPLVSRDEVLRIFHPNVRTPGVPGLEDLDITPTALEEYSLRIMRRFRSAEMYNIPIDKVEKA